MNELFRKAIERFEKEYPNCEIIEMSMLGNTHHKKEVIDAIISIQYCGSEAFINDGIIETKTIKMIVSIND